MSAQPPLERSDDSAPSGALPVDAPGAWRQNLRYDALSGFLVFLVALPLCLGIAMASGYPAIAGVVTAIVGGLICPLISNSEMTIKGPAAGLIVIVVGAVTELAPGDPERGYHLALGIGVVAGAIQIVFGLLRTGIVGEFFPTSTVHGMLAAIGVIIASKQVHTMLGVKPEARDPLALLAEIPHSIRHLNPGIALIGVASLAILVGMPRIRVAWVKRVPAPLIVVVTAIALGWYFDLEHEHVLSLGARQFSLGPRFLVDVPTNLANAIAFPDFSAITTSTGLKYIVMFSLVGTLESLLSAKAVELLDPYQRKTDHDRDILAVGVANTIASSIGGLPMISEIVRSSANINNGGRSRWANAFHGLFLLGFVALLPNLIHRIPLAALSAMLVYTGCRLASPREFWKTYKIGADQLIVFTSTLVGVLAIDLLVGIGVGVVVKIGLHVLRGAPLRHLFRPSLQIDRQEDGSYVVAARHSAVFSSWIPVKRQLARLDHASTVVLDLTDTRLVDHTVMEKLHELQAEYQRQNRRLVVRGLDDHRPSSSHPFATRTKAAAKP